MNMRERGKRNAAVVTGALVAAALGGTAAVVLAIQPASAATGTGTTSTEPSTSSQSSDDNGFSADEGGSGDSGSVHGQSGGS